MRRARHGDLVYDWLRPFLGTKFLLRECAAAMFVLWHYGREENRFRDEVMAILRCPPQLATGLREKILECWHWFRVPWVPLSLAARVTEEVVIRTGARLFSLPDVGNALMHITAVHVSSARDAILALFEGDDRKCLLAFMECTVSQASLKAIRGELFCSYDDTRTYPPVAFAPACGLWGAALSAMPSRRFESLAWEVIRMRPPWERAAAELEGIEAEDVFWTEGDVLSIAEPRACELCKSWLEQAGVKSSATTDGEKRYESVIARRLRELVRMGMSLPLRLYRRFADAAAREAADRGGMLSPRRMVEASGLSVQSQCFLWLSSGPADLTAKVAEDYHMQPGLTAEQLLSGDPPPPGEWEVPDPNRGEWGRRVWSQG